MTTTLEAINTGAFQLPEPSNDPAAPLVMRLARDFGAAWVDEKSVADWAAGAGDRWRVRRNGCACCSRATPCVFPRGKTWPPCCLS